MRTSMDGRGRTMANIFIERLWRSVEYGEFYLHDHTDGVEPHRGLRARLPVLQHPVPASRLGSSDAEGSSHHGLSGLPWNCRDMAGDGAARRLLGSGNRKQTRRWTTEQTCARFGILTVPTMGSISDHLGGPWWACLRDLTQLRGRAGSVGGLVNRRSRVYTDGCGCAERLEPQVRR